MKKYFKQSMLAGLIVLQLPMLLNCSSNDDSQNTTPEEVSELKVQLSN